MNFEPQIAIPIVIATTIALVVLRNRIEAARKKRDLQRPIIELGLGGYVFTSGQQISEVVCVAFPSAYADDVTGIFPMSFSVRNKGKKTLRNAVLTIQASADVLIYDPQDPNYKPVLANLHERIKRSKQNTGHLNTVAFQIESLNPGVGMNFVEPIQMKPWLETKYKFPVTCKDGVTLNAEVTVPIHLTCLVGVFGEDFPPVAMSCVFDCLHAASLDDAKKRWVEINKGANKLSNVCVVTFMLFEQDFATKTDEGKTVIFMKAENEKSVRKIVSLR